MNRTLLMALALMVGSTPAVAQEQDAARGKVYVEAGVKLFKAKDYEGALVEFRRAEPMGAALGDMAGIRFNIARCLEELGRPAEAIPAFERYLALSDRESPRRRAKRAIERLANRVGSLAIQCDAAGTVIRVGDRTYKCPTIVGLLAPGRHTVSAVGPSGRTWSSVVNVEGGSVKEVRMGPAHPSGFGARGVDRGRGPLGRWQFVAWSLVGAVVGALGGALVGSSIGATSGNEHNVDTGARAGGPIGAGIGALAPAILSDSAQGSRLGAGLGSLAGTAASLAFWFGVRPRDPGFGTMFSAAVLPAVAGAAVGFHW
jgi:hypothetical protein